MLRVIFNITYFPKAHTCTLIKIKYACRVASRRASPLLTHTAKLRQYPENLTYLCKASLQPLNLWKRHCQCVGSAPQQVLQTSMQISFMHQLPVGISSVRGRFLRNAEDAFAQIPPGTSKKRHPHRCLRQYSTQEVHWLAAEAALCSCQKSQKRKCSVTTKTKSETFL